MRAVFLALALTALGAASVFAQAKGAIQPTKTADFGTDFLTPMMSRK